MWFYSAFYLKKLPNHPFESFLFIDLSSPFLELDCVLFFCWFSRSKLAEDRFLLRTDIDRCILCFIFELPFSFLLLFCLLRDFLCDLGADLSSGGFWLDKLEKMLLDTDKLVTDVGLLDPSMESLRDVIRKWQII